MRSIFGYIAAATLGLAGTSSPALAEYVVIEAPAEQPNPEEADLIERGRHAFSRYLAACDHHDWPALRTALTDDAVIEYPLTQRGRYLLVYANLVGRHCRSLPATTRLAELSVYPTNAVGVLLVSYALKSRRVGSQRIDEHLALFEMRREKICRIRDFSATGRDLRRELAQDHHAPRF